MKKPVVSDDVIQSKTVENLVGSQVVDIVLYRFRKLIIKKGNDDIGISFNGSQSEVVSLYHYVVGNNYYVCQRLKEQEKEKRERKDKRKAHEIFSPKGSNLDINICLPEDFHGIINLLLCDGESEISVEHANINLKAVTTNIIMDKTGPLEIESGDSNIMVKQASGKTHILKAVNSTIKVESGNINGLTMEVESIDKGNSEIYLGKNLLISGKVKINNINGKIFQGDKLINSVEEITKKTTRVRKK